MYLILYIAILLLGLMISSSVFDGKLPDVINNLLDTINSNVEQHKNLIGWVAFVLGVVTLISGPFTMLLSLVGIVLGVYALNDELLKIPSIGEMLHNLSDGLSKYKEVLAILGVVFGLYGLITYIF